MVCELLTPAQEMLQFLESQNGKNLVDYNVGKTIILRRLNHSYAGRFFVLGTVFETSQAERWTPDGKLVFPREYTVDRHAFLFLNQKNSQLCCEEEWFEKNSPEGILRSKLRSSSFHIKKERLLMGVIKVAKDWTDDNRFRQKAYQINRRTKIEVLDARRINEYISYLRALV